MDHTPFPDPGVLPFAPEGFFTGLAALTGDASGGTARLFVRSTRGKEFLYLLDSLSAASSTADGGEGLIVYTMYRGEGLTGRLANYRTIGSHNTGHGRRYPQGDLEPPNMILGTSRRAMTTVDLIIVEFNWQLNVNTVAYEFLVSGRYYRKAMSQDPGFLRTVLGRG